MAYHIGHMKKKIKEYSLGRFLCRCADAEADGYELYKRTKKRDWPRLWRVKYKAEYRKYYIIDDTRIAYFPKKQIDYIVTGDLSKL